MSCSGTATGSGGGGTVLCPVPGEQSAQALEHWAPWWGCVGCAGPGWRWAGSVPRAGASRVPGALPCAARHSARTARLRHPEEGGREGDGLPLAALLIVEVTLLRFNSIRCSV